MIIQVLNLTARSVSLPGPLPRLLASESATTEITPEEYDRIKDELGELVNNSIIRVFMEIGGSFLGNFTFDDEAGSIKHKGIVIAEAGVSTDERVKVTSNDTTTDFLQDKIAAGSGIALNILNPGADEELEISAPGSTTDEKVKVTTNDTTPDFLQDKVRAGADVNLTVFNPAGDEELEVNVVAPTVPTANAIPRADGAGKLAAGWLPGTPPTPHASTHQDGGSDEVATATPAANAIPKATASGDLAGGWMPYGSAANTVCEGNDPRLSDARPPTSHGSTHENGGADEINVGGLSGTLADPQTPSSHASTHQHGGSDEIATATPAANSIPKTGGSAELNSWISNATETVAGKIEIATQSEVDTGTDTTRAVTPATLAGTTVTPESHASTHENGGADEINVGGLSGTLADPQTPSSHASTHENGGADEINVGGLSGTLADPQTPSSHASTHQHGGADEIATATTGANAIPKANATGTFNGGWIDDTSHGNRGNGSLHSVATTSVAGFMSAADKQSLDSQTGIVADTNEPNGFPNNTDSQISFVNGTLTFSIQPTVTSYYFYSDGVKYTKSGTDSKTIADSEGLHYFYFDDSGVLQTTQTFADNLLKRYAIVAILYWDAVNNQAIYFGDERHGIVMDGATHEYLHEINGAQWLSGLNLSNFITDGDGSLATHAQFAAADGVIRDEDIKFQITDDSPQDLAPTANIPIFYKLGAAGDWRVKTADSFPIIYNGTAGYSNPRIPYNFISVGSWQLIQASDGYYVLMHYFATNDVNTPVIGIQGQAEYADSVTARSQAEVEIANLATAGLPFVEFVPIATVIFQTATAYTNTPKARTISLSASKEYLDLRGRDYRPGSGLVSELPTHGGTHNPSGSDPLSTAAANTIQIGDSAAEGAANSYARSDHTHAVTAPGAPADVDKSAAVAGTSTTPARADHKHDISTGTPTGTVEIGDVGVEGTSTDLARVDHIHPVGTPAAPADVTKAAAATGTSVIPARADHKHDITTAVAIGLNANTTNAEGTATTLARSDHAHAIDVTNGTISTVNAGDAATEGTGTGVSRRDHQHAVSTGTPTGAVEIGDIGVEGTGTDLARVDHVHPVGTPAAPADVTKAAASAGTSVVPARADHKHDITTASPGASVDAGDTAAEGTATTLARSDHQHAVSTAAPSQGIGGGNSEGTATNLARSDHDHTIRETNGPTNLTVGAITDGQFLTRSGTAIVGVTRVFGNDYQTSISLSLSTTTATTPQNKVTLTTPALTGTYRVSWHAVCDCASTSDWFVARLYNNTDAAIVGALQNKESKDISDKTKVGGFAEIVFTGVAKSFIIQYYSNGGSTVGIEDARLEIWRVS